MLGFCEFAKEKVHWTWFTTWKTSSQYNSSSIQQQLRQSHCASQLISVWLYFVIKMVCFYTLKSARIVEQALTCSLGCGTIQLSAISVPKPRVILYQFWPFYKVSQLFTKWTSSSKQVTSILGRGINRYSIPIGVNSWAKKVTFLVHLH